MHESQVDTVATRNDFPRNIIAGGEEFESSEAKARIRASLITYEGHKVNTSAVGPSAPTPVYLFFLLS